MSLEHLKGAVLHFAKLRELATIHNKPHIIRKLDSVCVDDYDWFICDGCSLWPDNWGDFDACFWHDVLYYFGGTSEERLEADRELYAAILMKKGKVMAGIMFAGVRAGGWLPGTGFHWGYGLLR